MADGGRGVGNGVPPPPSPPPALLPRPSGAFLQLSCLQEAATAAVASRNLVTSLIPSLRRRLTASFLEPPGRQQNQGSKGAGYCNAQFLPRALRYAATVPISRTVPSSMRVQSKQKHVVHASACREFWPYSRRCSIREQRPRTQERTCLEQGDDFFGQPV